MRLKTKLGIKKVAMVVATLGVMGGIGSMALPVVAVGGDVAGLGESEAGVEGSNERWEEGLFLEANVINTDLQIGYLYPMHNYLTVWLTPSKTRALKRLVVAYYDYEQGVTEAEADAGLATLGEDAAEWAVVMYDKEYWLGMDGHNPVELSGFEVMVEGEFTDNKRDLLYYAAEFGEPELLEDGTTEWKNTVWLRGKYDYRSCIHGPDFKPELPNYVGLPTCFSREGEDGKYMITATEGGEVVAGILTWEEEWRQIQLERLQGVVVEMGAWGAEWQEEAVRVMLERLQKLEVTLAVSTGVEDLLVVERALTEQLEGWLGARDEGEVGIGVGGDKGEVGIGVGGDKGEVETSGNDVLVGGGQGGGAVVVGQADGVGVLGQMSGATVVSGANGNSRQIGGEEVAEAEIGETEGESGALAEGDSEGSGGAVEVPALEVPALGEVEQRSGFPWWVLVVLLVMGSGLAGWLLYGRKRRERR